MPSDLPAVLETGNWELTAHDEKSAVFRRTLPELKLEIVKRYTLAAVPADQVEEVDYPAIICSSMSSCATPTDKRANSCLSARWPDRHAAGRLVVCTQDQPALDAVAGFAMSWFDSMAAL